MCPTPLESACLLRWMTNYRSVFWGKMSLTLLYLSIYQDAQEQHGDNQIGIVQQLHKEGMWWHHCWSQCFYYYPDHWYHIAVVLICWFTHALFDKNNKIHERLTITGNKKVWAFYWVLCVTVFSLGIIFISIFIFLMLSFNSFFIFFSQINMKEKRWKCRFLDCHTQIKVFEQQFARSLYQTK